MRKTVGILLLILTIALLVTLIVFRGCSHARHEHTPGDWITDRAPTCEGEGQRHRVCAVCGKTLETEVLPALGHDWGETSYAFSADGTTCVATRVCRRDASHRETATAVATSEVLKAPTCTEGGETFHAASFQELWAAMRTTVTAGLPATGHAPGGWVTDRAPTCAEAGRRIRVCETCGETLETEVLPALGHDWGEPTYVFSEDGRSCTATRVCRRDASHAETAAAAVTGAVSKAPTCEGRGETTYTAVFSADWAETQTRVVPDVPALGHDWGEPAYVFSEDGRSCTATRVCRRDAAHVQTAAAAVTGAVSKAPTCEGRGETTYTAVFSEGWAETQTRVVLDVPALGHDWGEPTYVFSEDGRSCTATRVCRRDASHVQTAAAAVTGAVTKPATYEERGETTYTAAFSEGWAETQTRVVADIPVADPRWGTPTYAFSEDGRSCTATRISRQDPLLRQTAAAAVTGAVSKAPTCEGRGETTYTAVFSEGWAETQTRIVPDVPALGHDWGEPTYVFSEDGRSCTATRVCRRDASHAETVSAVVAGEVSRAPTCTERGETTYTASFAEGWAETQTRVVPDVPATGHAPGGWVTDRAPTCTETGRRSRTCAVCGETLETEVLPALGHDWGEPTYVFAEDGSACTATRVCRRDAAHRETASAVITDRVTREPTCVREGARTYTASFAAGWARTRTRTVPIPALGHEYAGADRRCVRCGETDGACFLTSGGRVTGLTDAGASLTAIQIPRTIRGETITAIGDRAFADLASLTSIEIPNTVEAIGVEAFRGCAALASVTFEDGSRLKTVSEGAFRACASLPGIVLPEGVTRIEAGLFEGCAALESAAIPGGVGRIGHRAFGDCASLDRIEFGGAKDQWARTDREDGWDEGAGCYVVRCADGALPRVHDWGEPTYAFAEDGRSCTATRVCRRDASHAETVSAIVAGEVSRAPTCTEWGETTYTASFAQGWAETQTRVVLDVPALGHDWGEPTYVFSEDGRTCTATRVCRRDGAREEVTVTTAGSVTRPATCAEPGATTYRAAFDADWAEDQTKVLRDIPKLGHDWNDPVYTFSEDGKSCVAERTCKRNAAHREQERVTTTVLVTRPATCLEAGQTTYTAAFTSPWAAERSVTLTDIPALGHDWGETTYAFSEDWTTCTATRVCRRDAAHSERVLVTTTSEVTRAPTCAEAGQTTYAAVFSVAWARPQTRVVANLPALGHDWGETTYVFSEDGRSCTAARVCRRDGAREEVTVTTVREVTKAPTCEGKGEATYRAEFSADWAEARTMTAEIPALGHHFVDGVCTRCGRTQ